MVNHSILLNMVLLIRTRGDCIQKYSAKQIQINLLQELKAQGVGDHTPNVTSGAVLELGKLLRSLSCCHGC